jgi:hypothetical protein
MQRVFSLNGDNSDLIRSRERLERSHSANKLDRWLGKPSADQAERTARVEAILQQVVESQSDALQQAGINVPVQFGVRADQEKGPGCVLGRQCYIIGAGSQFIAKGVQLNGDPVDEGSQRLTDLLDKGPDTPHDPKQVVHYATELNKQFPSMPRHRMDEKTLQASFLHELGHVVNGDPAGLPFALPERVRKGRRLAAIVVALLVGGALTLIGIKPVQSLAIGIVVAIPTIYITTWAGWKGYSLTDGALREREIAADHTLIRDPKMMQSMGRYFKHKTILEAARYLRSGKSEAEVVKLLQMERNDHPKSLNRWRSFSDKINQSSC